MTWENQTKQASFYLQQMKNRIPKDNTLSIIDEQIDLSFINEITKPYYSRLGPIGYAPERLFRMLIVMYMENIPSERRLVEQLNENIRYMYFTKTDLDDPIPDHSTFSVLRRRLGDEVFKEIFQRILKAIIDLGVTHPKSISVDSSSVLADVKIPTKEDKGAKEDGKQVLSPNDPDARYGRTSIKNIFFGYKAQIMIDNETQTILNIDAKPGNAQDLNLEESFVKEPIGNNNLKPEEAALDKGFNSYRIRRLFKEQKIKAAIPVRSERCDRLNYYKEGAFQIDLKHKKVVCPTNKELKYMTFDSKMLTHEFIGTDCCNCKLKKKCTPSQARRFTVHQDYILRQKAISFNRTKRYREIFKKRSSVERVIAEAKRFHGMFRAKFRRLWKLKIQLYLTAIVINLKRTAKFFIEQRLDCVNIRGAGP